MKQIKGFVFHTDKGHKYSPTPTLRLKLFKELAQSYASKDWREARSKIHPFEPVISPGYNSRYSGTPHERRVPVMYGHQRCVFRRERWADEVPGVRMGHTGWFSDTEGSRTMRGFVFELPHGRYGSGYEDSDSGEVVYYCNVFDSAIAAARFADSEAQFYAEQERDHDFLWCEREKVQHEREDNREKLRRLLYLRHHPKLSNIREEIEQLLYSLRQQRARLQELNKELGEE